MYLYRYLIASLEYLDVPDPEFTRDVSVRAAKLSAECQVKKARLTELENTTPSRQCPGLLDRLPAGIIDFDKVPEAMLRRLFEAFHLRMRYDRATNEVHCQITVTPETLKAQHEAAKGALKSNEPAHNGDRVRVCGAPPAGFEPAYPAPEAVGKWTAYNALTSANS